MKPQAVPAPVDAQPLAEQPRRRAFALAVSILTLTLFSFFQFPGHTILQSDTQIYIPMLERLADPTLFANDFMATRPHLNFTLYDEIALGIHAVTGAGFESILMTEQFVYRALAIYGVYLLGTSLGFSTLPAALIAAIVSLGATVNGPAVLSVEYEPVPRGFAFPFLILSLACVGHRRWSWAAGAATVAFGFHPPTALAFVALLFVLLVFKKRLKQVSILAVGPAVMIATLVLSPGAAEPTPLFERIDPALESIQRMRASYNWVSIWIADWKNHFLFVWAVSLGALWRLKERVSPELLLFLGGLPLIGVLSVPASYWLLEGMKWNLIPQFQPARYLLFATWTAALFSAATGVQASQRRRWWEALPFFVVAFSIPMDPKVTNILSLADGLSSKRLALAAMLGCLCMGAIALRAVRWSVPAFAAAAALPFVMIPTWGQVRTYAPLHHPELNALAAWARDSTTRDAVFQFANNGRELPPGVFRVRAKRALYTDWKAGGQVNFMKSFAFLWWDRWQFAEAPRELEAYKALGIDYVVFKAGMAPPGAVPVYANAKYVVVDLRRR